MKKKGDQKKTDADTVLTDFKKAAHALMDALELGLFTRVEVLDSGELCECRRGPIAHADRLEVRRYKNGELHLSCQFLEKSDDTQMKMYAIEDLWSKQGLFLDQRDAQILQMHANVQRLKEDQEQAMRKARQKQDEIDKFERKIAKLSQKCYNPACQITPNLEETKENEEGEGDSHEDT